MKPTNKPWIYHLLIALIFLLIGWFANTAYHLPAQTNPIAEIKPRPLDKYSIVSLKSAYNGITPSSINMEKALKEDPKYTSYEFNMNFDPTLTTGQEKTVSGLINIPKGKGPFPLIVMVRGYVDQKEYFIGEGTQHAGEVFAQNGFITIAPDFLGYGDSDTESSNIFESRFQTYTTMMALLKSASTIDSWDQKNIFIWAHSNGGQIALSTLEITGANYPTVLWAPNSARFPYSILYYLDEADDQGKLIITKLAEFMSDYEASRYSFDNYLNTIKAPIQLNQGTSDNSVPSKWSDKLNRQLKDLDIDNSYIKYPGADHNLQPSWNLAVQNSLSFFQKHLEK